MSDFLTLPEGSFTLDNIRIPAAMIGESGDLVETSLSVADGLVTDTRQEQIIDLGGAMVMPCPVDMHTHLDKGHIWTRAPNPDGSFMGALETVSADRAANWSADDVRARMEFSLKCAYAHGTRAIRTHLDSLPPQADISWPVFAELRDIWADRINLQACCLTGIDHVPPNGGTEFDHTADIVASTGGVLGVVTYPVDDLRDRLVTFFEDAGNRGLETDFHVDETGDPSVATLRMLAQVVLETGFDKRVVAGHCCSLAVQDEKDCAETLELVAEAGIHIVSLPMCNLYLQDRNTDPSVQRTPRWRGITVVHEMRALGIPISFASDNTRDPFYAYGDMDMLEVMREATRIGHLDHSSEDWPASFTATPATTCGFEERRLSAGEPADFIILSARSWTECFARPQSDRIVVRNGRAIDRTLPSYSELDHRVEPA
ncbi:MAG: cytosine deaminase [Ahrensia sp.]|nr:cytosine deaminase [Ahrensia sp.]